MAYLWSIPEFHGLVAGVERRRCFYSGACELTAGDASASLRFGVRVSKEKDKLEVVVKPDSWELRAEKTTYTLRVVIAVMRRMRGERSNLLTLAAQPCIIECAAGGCESVRTKVAGLALFHAQLEERADNGIIVGVFAAECITHEQLRLVGTRELCAPTHFHRLINQKRETIKIQHGFEQVWRDFNLAKASSSSSWGRCNSIGQTPSVWFDVTIVVGQQRIMAHREVLEARSGYFWQRVAFDDAAADEIKLRLDITPSIFLKALRFMYFDEVAGMTNSFSEILDVHDAACHLLMPDLAHLMEDVFRMKLTPGNVVAVLASLNDDCNMWQICREFMVCHAREVSQGAAIERFFCDPKYGELLLEVAAATSF